MATIRKIIFFVESFFNESYYKQFGIDVLKENGFEVEVWDFTKFLAPLEYQETKLPDPITWDKHRLFGSEKEALFAISTLDKSSYIIGFIHYNLQTFAIFKTLSKKDIRYCIPGFALPSGTSSAELFLKRLKKLRLKKIIPFAFKVIPFEYLGIRPADIVLAWAEMYNTVTFTVNNDSEILWVHSFDYDTYLKEKEFSDPIDTNVGVFLDEYLPFHPDTQYIGRSVPITPSEYYTKLCMFFEFLEKSFNVRIIIAAHPRACYDDKKELYGGRTIIRGDTGNVVKRSGFVLLHHSTAINFAILFKKPMIFITSHKLNNGMLEDPSVEWLADYFGKKAHNLDEKIDVNFEKELTIDKNAYRTYKNAYIKKDGSEELPFWQIFANRIKRFG